MIETQEEHDLYRWPDASTYSLSPVEEGTSTLMEVTTVKGYAFEYGGYQTHSIRGSARDMLNIMATVKVVTCHCPNCEPEADRSPGWLARRAERRG